MKKRMSKWLVIAAVMTMASTVIAQVKTGGQAPGFSLPDIHGNVNSLSSFAGKYVVLEWNNHDCPFVVKHYDTGNMQALQKDAADKGVIWLTICSSAPGKQGNFSPEEHQKILAKKGFSGVAYLLDVDGKVGRLYAAKTTPHMFIINPEGKVIYQGAIDDDSSAKKESIKTANNYVSAALEAALNGEEVDVSTTAPYGCSVKY